MQEQLETTLAKLIAIPSESADKDSCQEIIEFVRGSLEPLGLHITADVESQHPWLIATTQATKSPKILLVAHLDVVPATVEGQYELKIQGERLYGRGVWDMKFASAVYLDFLKANAELLPELDLGVLFTTDEEIGGYQGVAEVLRQGWRTELALIPDHNDNWRVEEMAKGVYGTKLSATGRSAHGSRPWEGDNAVQKLIPILHELQTLYPSEEQLGPTLSINMLSGGKVLNQIPEEAAAWLDFRAFAEPELEEYKTLLHRLAGERGLEVSETVTGLPHILDKSHLLVKQYKDALKSTGIGVAYQKSFGTSDARWFAEYKIPCIVTGPHGERAHGADEWMERRALQTFYSILEHFIPAGARLEGSELRQTQSVDA